MIGRRAFLRGVALVGVGPTLGAVSKGHAGQMLPLPHSDHPPMPPEVAGEVSQTDRALRRLLRREEKSYERRQCFKVDGFDADIQALRSPSVAYKVYMQRKREQAAISLMLRLRERLRWW